MNRETNKAGAVLALAACLWLGTGEMPAARDSGSLELPAWTDEDDTKYAAPGSFFLGGGLLPAVEAEEGIDAPDASDGAEGEGTGQPGGTPPGPGGVAAAGDIEGEAPVDAPDTPLRPKPRPRPVITLPPPRVGIPVEFRAAYFNGRPEKVLVDPQRMLTEPKTYNIEEFLTYHEQESPFRICVLLFEGDQELPDDLALANLHEEWFGDEPVVLMAYFMGRPEYAQLEFGAAVGGRMPRSYFEEVLESCVEEGKVVENAFHQFERFAIELSVQLYWLEKEAGVGGRRLAAGAGNAEAGFMQARLEAWRPYFPWLVGSPLALGMLWGVGWLTSRVLFRRGRVFVFPEIEVEPRLGAPHSGGGHVLFSYGSTRR